jgi:LemA protein
MSNVVVALVVVLAAGVLLTIVVIGMFNALVRRRNQVDNAWSQIDVQLKRRHDLVGNLMETARGYAAHERGVFETVAQARSAAVNATDPGATAQAENGLTQALKSLFAVAEAYPELKADRHFSELQEELSATESKVAYARQYYNDAVNTFNNSVQTFPGMLVAQPMGFHPRPYFETSDSEAEPVQVRFDR